MFELRQWSAALGCLCILVVTGHSAAFPTEETIVVTRDDTVPTETSVSEEPTTEEHTPPIKMTEMDVKSEVSFRYAHTSVVAHVRNPAKRAQEAHFRVLLPSTAFITGFVMTIDGKSYKAYVKEKEEAKQIYQEAVSQGIGAAHIATKARDSNHFTINVNVEPSTPVIFNLTYEELLTRREGMYNQAINLHPGSLVPKLTVQVHIKESAKITELRVPEIRTGNEVDASKDDAQLTNVKIERSDQDRQATITFKPDLEEQKRLMQLYAEKSKESASESNGDGILGQFVVQYDVDRSKGGEILVNDGYFVHFFAPTDLPPLNKYVVFVLDTSGSMSGRKIEQLREAMLIILSELNPGDYFSLIDFESSVTVHELNEADKEPPKRTYYYYGEKISNPSLKPPSQATPENIAKAKVIVSRLDAYGGTNIGSALNIAVDLINKREEWGKVNPNETTTLTPVADDVVDNKKLKALEPIIIFLTDGDPTVGETNPQHIINQLSEKNLGENKATIFSLAFGEDADRKFLRKLSLRNEGLMRHIYEAPDATLQLRNFYREISSPLLSNVKFIYPPDQVKESSVTKHKYRSYYAGSELVVAGELVESATEVSSQTLAFCGVENDGASRRDYERKLKAPTPATKMENFPLERLWAYLTIKQLLDEKDAADEQVAGESDKEKPEKKALRIALKYEFVTSLTSLVVVKPNATNAVNAESVDKTSDDTGFGNSVAPLSASFGAPASAYGFAAFPAAPPPSADIQPSALFIESFAEEEPIDDYGSVVDGLPVAFRRTSYHDSSWMPIRHYAMYNSVPHIDIFGSPPLSTRIPFTTPATNDEYHLNEFSWAEPLIDHNSDTLVINGTTPLVTLKLTKDSNVPRSSGGDKECSNAVEGGNGLCVYLTRCDAAKNINVDEYKSKYCSVDGFAGVCCPRSMIDVLRIR